MEDSTTTHFGREQVPVAEKAARVAQVFDSVASRYDIMNDIMSLGSHRLMKRIAVELTCARPGDVVVDLAGGTGDLTRLLSPIVGPDGKVILCDINASMVSVGRDRLINQGIVGNVEYCIGDAEALPLADNSIDVIIMAFGLRNVTRKEEALKDMARVLRGGGHLVVLEFSQVEQPVLRGAYDMFRGLWPRIGEAITGDRDSYRYLVESIDMHPGQEELADMMRRAHFDSVQYHNFFAGVAAIHVGIKAQ